MVKGRPGIEGNVWAKAHWLFRGLHRDPSMTFTQRRVLITSGCAHLGIVELVLMRVEASVGLRTRQR